MVTHFVLTRFNPQIPTVDDGAGLDADWLTHRFELFDRFCFPAMQSQTVTARWLVFFDARTPDRLLARIETYRARLPSMEPILVKGVLTDTRIAKYVGDRLVATDDVVCTTRLDNDDAIGQTFIGRVQTAATASAVPRFINFPLGYQWHGGGLYLCLDFANPFVSFVERVREMEPPQTVMCDVSHRDIASVASVTQVKTRPLWIQVVHGRNLANTSRGVRRLRRRSPKAFRGQTAITNVISDAPPRGVDFLVSLGRLAALVAYKVAARMRAATL